MNKKIYKEIFEWVRSIFIAVVIAICIQIFISPTIVNGESMYPTLENNDFLIINKLAYTNKLPNRGDIIAFKTDLIDSKTNKKKDLIKRVIALPGERITIKDYSVYINGQLFSENYINNIDTSGDIDIIVPEGHVFVLGDNRGNSADSRDSIIGTIRSDDIIGKASVRLFPFNKIGKLSN